MNSMPSKSKSELLAQIESVLSTAPYGHPLGGSAAAKGINQHILLAIGELLDALWPQSSEGNLGAAQKVDAVPSDAMYIDPTF